MVYILPFYANSINEVLLHHYLVLNLEKITQKISLIDKKRHFFLLIRQKMTIFAANLVHQC